MVEKEEETITSLNSFINIFNKINKLTFINKKKYKILTTK